MAFVENLAALPEAQGSSLKLLDEQGREVAAVENAPGTAGSFRVYAYLAGKWGGITADAAEEGLRLYAEHTDDARANPGRHPNIDRLFEVANKQRSFRAVIE